MKFSDKYKLTGTKAETLEFLLKKGYSVPKIYFFTVKEWNLNKEKIIKNIMTLFSNDLLAIRSSTKAEDTEDSSMAGAFESVLNIKPEKDSIFDAIKFVISSYDEDDNNQVLIQRMVKKVSMSGVVMTQVLDDGSPYHVINYDDRSGLTDTVTSGSTINKTVYIYNGVDPKDFDSKYLLAVLKLVRNLQKTFPDIPIDIEFAIDNSFKMYLLQVRKITTITNWKKNINDQVSSRMLLLKGYVQQLMQKRPNLYGNRTLLGIMPDWNPAEMIGVVPHPLALSLYRELITKRTWSIARETMGYRKMPNTELMVSLFGRSYIDVRNSINSFLPEGLSNNISEKLVNAYIKRLDDYPHLHDKIEFEVVHTSYDFDFNKNFKRRYKGLLKRDEFLTYKDLLLKITKKAINNSYDNSLNSSLRDIKKLKKIQSTNFEYEKNSFSIADRINTLIDECKRYGTIPFSIIARHAFIAENLLRSAVNNNVLTNNRIKEFKSSIITVARDLSYDFQRVINDQITKDEYLSKYGHLRPGSYDILSPNYSNRKDLFDGNSREYLESIHTFNLTEKEKSAFNLLLKNHEFENIEAEDIISYSVKAIKGREYAKFIFTKHLSEILESIAEWGDKIGFSRSNMSMLTINDVLKVLFSPLTDDLKSYFEKKIKKAETNFKIASSFKLSYLIRSVRDVYIVPMQRSSANFIGDKRIEGEIIELNQYLTEIPSLENKIICIEGADPGYDWIFTRNIAGLITKYGGANSHMAIRSAEYSLPAAIGCGEQTYNRILLAKKCLLDCQRKNLEPIEI